ncbi:MAG TPA: bifunctional (p)ppGpp synthetase/guanosine-3',5'-bis(diphosphate) 3'-pyrophosphohydrolase [Acidimicrobiales bacterium]|nr:bifunctional (p)ppGpp synthetase/guanosine-3',5'-bis(diphosphate) 3'-pyrophosphohydrolase [Acidimicrobiales bacterium]
MALAARAPLEGTETKGREAQVESALDQTEADLLAKVIEAFLRRHPDEDTAMIEGAAETAAVAHAGQMRRSGEPYITHPIAVAGIVAELGLDTQTIAAALLHDAVEDTGVTNKVIKHDFGDAVAAIVEGVTKLDRLQFDSKEAQQAATVRKMLVAMADDWRVLIIKLADRLHNMRTLSVMPEWKQHRTAQETLDIYAPLAHRLGIQEVKWQLEDLAFATLHPKRYAEIEQMVASRAPLRDEYLARVLVAVRERLHGSGINAEVTGRPKHLWSIYEKMVVRGKEFDDLYDLVGMRVIVEAEKDCWAALGSIHAIWPPVQGRFKDYINSPKFNLYQSLHTTVIGLDGKPIEVQVRTHEMHRRAEYGIAAHWGYKEKPGRDGPDKSAREKNAKAKASGDTQVLADPGAEVRGEGGGSGQAGGDATRTRTGDPVKQAGPTKGPKSSKKGRGSSNTAEADRRAERQALARETSSTIAEIEWMQRIADFQNETTDPIEFLEALKLDLEQDEVYVFTPKGKVIALTANATPVDFAYAIHTEVGHRCVGATVNGRLVPLETTLNSADTVEIITSKAPTAGPSRDWLNLAASSRARTKIRQWFSRERREDAIEIGREELTKELRREGLPVQKLASDHALVELAETLNYADLDALHAAIGDNRISARAVTQRLMRELRGGVYDEQLPVTARRQSTAGRPGQRSDVGVYVEGLDDLVVRLSRCCTPVPGDEIIGFVTRGRGVSVHRADCSNAASLASRSRERLIEVEWDHRSSGVFVATIEVVAIDRSRLLTDVSEVVSEHHLNILAANTQTDSDRISRMRFDVELGDANHLESVLNSIRHLDAVYDAYRILPGKKD